MSPEYWPERAALAEAATDEERMQHNATKATLAQVDADRDLLASNVAALTQDLNTYRTYVRALHEERANLRKQLDAATKLGTKIAGLECDGDVEDVFATIRKEAGL